LRAAQAREASGKVFNVANGETVSINEVLETLKKLTGRTEVNAEYAETRPGDVRDSLADLNAAKSSLGYAPTVGLEAGLKLTLDWWKTSRFSQSAKSG
jgi:nucleoside-diphosphate-sugar epimerase